jgi:D-alanyl-D-alanine dipeptidase
LSWDAGLHPSFAPYARYLVDVARANGLGPVVTSAYRSYSQQAVLYRRFLAGQSSLPAAPPGRSKHQFGLAIDVDLPQNRQYLAALGRWWLSIGGGWFPSDPVHFEAP